MLKSRVLPQTQRTPATSLSTSTGPDLIRHRADFHRPSRANWRTIVIAQDRRRAWLGWLGWNAPTHSRRVRTRGLPYGTARTSDVVGLDERTVRPPAYPLPHRNLIRRPWFHSCSRKIPRNRSTSTSGAAPSTPQRAAPPYPFASFSAIKRASAASRHWTSPGVGAELDASAHTLWKRDRHERVRIY
jgi:hypothetical protein